MGRECAREKGDSLEQVRGEYPRHGEQHREQSSRQELALQAQETMTDVALVEVSCSVTKRTSVFAWKGRVCFICVAFGRLAGLARGIVSPEVTCGEWEWISS